MKKKWNDFCFLPKQNQKYFVFTDYKKRKATKKIETQNKIEIAKKFESPQKNGVAKNIGVAQKKNEVAKKKLTLSLQRQNLEKKDKPLDCKSKAFKNICPQNYVFFFSMHFI